MSIGNVISPREEVGHLFGRLRFAEEIDLPDGPHAYLTSLSSADHQPIPGESFDR